MPFEPIAIVGRACVLPGALDPKAFGLAVLSGRDLVSACPPGRWRIPPADVLDAPAPDLRDRAFSDRGGYVTGFESVFDPGGFALPAEELLGLDPLVLWLLHAGREALRDTARGEPLAPASLPRAGAGVGVIMGNLSLPSEGLAQFAESFWLDAQGAGFMAAGRARALAGVPASDPRNRFVSGLPAHLLARALGLGGPAFALDAACASSLYAIKLACDRLHDRSADLMLAGAVNRADDLFLHVGFSALAALSPSGLSRPFHRGADGLLPAEGAAMVALKRLDDALAAGDRILGLIRGVGLSNDGRGQGLLVPSADGQERALRAAYAQSGIDPKDVSLVECHATGTALGDATEIVSLSRVFAKAGDLPIGSVKSNLGHPITASGLAGLLKVLASMEAGVRPPTLHVEDPTEALRGTPLRLLREAESWPADRPRLAAVSSFGFGGNNAHLLVEQWLPGSRPTASVTVAAAKRGEIAVVALGVRVADSEATSGFERAVLGGRSLVHEREGAGPAACAEAIELDLQGLRFPPADLEEALPQQLLVLAAARDALAGVVVPHERTSAFVGMGCDAEIARYGARVRVREWAAAWAAEAGATAEPRWLDEAQQAFDRPLAAATVLGRLPNVVANRLSSQFDLRAPSFSVSAEELSGVRALELAERALLAGEIDTALVGAVDVCCEDVHEAAARALLPPACRTPGDAAVVLVLKRLEDARRDGDPVLALVSGDGNEDDGVRLAARDLVPVFGHAHAASGLLGVAAAVAACHRRALPLRTRATPWLPALGPRAAAVATEALGGASARVRVREGPLPSPGFAALPAPRVFVFSGAGRAEVGRALRAGDSGSNGTARFAIVAADPEELARKREQALHLLSNGAPERPAEGLFFRESPLTGDVAFVFPAAAAAYAGMGSDVLLAWPELLEQVAGQSVDLGGAAGWAYAAAATEPGPTERLWGASLLSQAFAVFARDVLGLEPRAALGISSGETNALVALGAWTDLAELRRDFDAAGIFGRFLSGAQESVPREGRPWVSWRVAAPEEEVAHALRREPLVQLTIAHAPGDFVIGGQAEACERAVGAIGRERCWRTGFDVAVHCAAVAEIAPLWRRVHHRATRPVAGVRFYTNATGASYTPTADTAADALLGQATRTIRFAETVERAYADGARVFVELGPRAGCTSAIKRILGEREHLAVALDAAETPGLRPLVHAVAQLLAAGVPIRPAFGERLERLAASPRPRSGTTRRFAAHRSPVRLPRLAAAAAEAQTMAHAPALPRVLPSELPSVDVAAAGRPGPEATATARGALSAHPLVAVYSSHVGAQLEAQDRFLGTLQRLAEAHSGFLHASEAALAGLRRALGASQISPSESLRVPEAHEVSTQPRVLHLTREDLVTHASGRISAVFGPQFAQQDAYMRQVRMPEPPLLLADRATGIDATPGELGRGTVWTETDVRSDAFYLHHGRMPAGIMIESGQADLLLISYMGVDSLNRGERVYRLLGCELTFHGGLPKAGDTLRFDIHVDGHAQQGDVRLFFFHYDCRIGGEVRLSVRNGQAGFFTDGELLASAGVLWDAETAAPPQAPAPDLPRVASVRKRFEREHVTAFSEGRLLDCFGPGYEWAEAHVRTPRIPAGRMCLLQEVAELLPAGGPWRRGYLRAVSRIRPDDWFFQGHFKNDPCMPGTLMAEGCLQAMAFYLAALGFTLDKDGWRFEPVPDEMSLYRCRGQVLPSSRELIYELYVSELRGGDEPRLFADLLCTVDGLKAFHAARMGVRLVPDWPLEERPELLASGSTKGRPATTLDGFHFDWPALLACAWGRPSRAFGPAYRAFDGARRLPRLPGPPYHFMSRVTRTDGAFGVVAAGALIEAEYDVPEDAWYFAESGQGAMPWCVLMEAALQPCGWLTSYLGVPLASAEDLSFRNLEGTAVVKAPLGPGAGTLTTRVKSTSISQSGGLTIEAFEVECLLEGHSVLTMSTTFGHFLEEALAHQVGIPPTEQDVRRLEEPSDFAVDLAARPARFFEGPLRLPGPKLMMLDRITGFWPRAGRAGLGRLRAEKTVVPGEWFFKSHFFQDPVQPGSLGIEAMLQLVQFYVLERGLAEGIAEPRFEAPALEATIAWKYRGQVLPTNARVEVEAEIVSVERAAGAVLVLAEAWLWVDGTRIYQAKDLAVRVASGAPARDASLPEEALPPASEEALDPDVDTWLLDHRPTYSVPVVPMMWIVDRLALAARKARPSLVVVGLAELQVSRWLAIAGAPLRLRVDTEAADGGVRVSLLVWREAKDERLSRFEPVATGRVLLAEKYGESKAPFAPLLGALPVPDPYASGELFHGPALQVMRSLLRGRAGASAILDAGAGRLPVGLLNPALLDGATHAFPNDAMELWFSERVAGLIAYPARIPELRVFCPTPAEGLVRCEVRPVSEHAEGRFVECRVQLLASDEPWLEMRIVSALFPKGPLGAAPRPERRAFLRDRIAVPGLGLSRNADGTTRLSEQEVKDSDWLPGTVAATYGASGDLASLTRAVAVKEHIGRRAGVHPSAVRLDADMASGGPADEPLLRHRVGVAVENGELLVRSAAEPEKDLSVVSRYWRARLAVGPWPLEDLHVALIDLFVGRLKLADGSVLAQLQGRPALYLANHQVAVESLTFVVLISALTGVPAAAIAKAEHRDTWIGWLLQHARAYPGIERLDLVEYFEREDQLSLVRIAQDMRRALATGGRSYLVHVEGTRSLLCGRPVSRVSSAFLELALTAHVPIVPVRFAGALPREEATVRLEFPFGFAAQDVYLGRPVWPEALRGLSLVDQKRHVLAALNAPGPALEAERSNPGRPELAEAVAQTMSQLGVGEAQAMALLALRRSPTRCAETEAVVTAVLGGGRFSDDAKGRWLAALADWLRGRGGPA